MYICVYIYTYIYIYMAVSYLNCIVRNFWGQQFQDFPAGPGLILGNICSTGWERSGTRHAMKEEGMLDLPVEIRPKGCPYTGPYSPTQLSQVSGRGRCQFSSKQPNLFPLRNLTHFGQAVQTCSPSITK